eukprot:584161-Amphidinium_carterae.1
MLMCVWSLSTRLDANDSSESDPPKENNPKTKISNDNVIDSRSGVAELASRLDRPWYLATKQELIEKTL